MLTRFARIQLIIFSVLSIVGTITMALVYIQAPTLLGIGRMTIAIDMPNSGGLYRFANVTYRGVQVGKVTALDLTDGPQTHARAILSLDSSVRIPANLRAEIRSVSAIGEQYVDLVPHADTRPYLHDGSVITEKDTSMPQAVGPVLDQLSTLLRSIPNDRINALLDETFTAFNGAGYDFGSLVDSTSTLSRDFTSVADKLGALIDRGKRFLDAQAASRQSLHTWTHSLAGVTDQLNRDDPRLRTIVQDGPPAINEVSRLFTQLKPTLPLLLANLTTIGQIGVTYNPSIQQVLILLPPFISTIQAALPRNNATGVPTGGEFGLTVGDPNPCTVGFLPSTQWRSPADTTTIDTPDGLYCKLPQDSPSTVRGARNYPCMGHPGKRAPTVQQCDSDKPYEPLAIRSHILGPGPFDPNLASQGVPPDERTRLGDHIFAPTPGTSPPDAVPAPGPRAPVLPEPPIPLDQPDPSPGPGRANAAPNTLHTNGIDGPHLGVAAYNPRTGNYLGPDSRLYNQADLIEHQKPRLWTDLLPH